MEKSVFGVSNEAASAARKKLVSPQNSFVFNLGGENLWEALIYTCKAKSLSRIEMLKTPMNATSETQNARPLYLALTNLFYFLFLGAFCFSPVVEYLQNIGRRLTYRSLNRCFKCSKGAKQWINITFSELPEYLKILLSLLFLNWWGYKPTKYSISRNEQYCSPFVGFDLEHLIWCISALITSANKAKRSWTSIC